MIHSPGDETSTARIHYIELTEAGQAFKLGRYAIHFHMIGTVHGSLVKGNAVHHSYNRACTTHGVHYFRVEKNVAYDTMGHSFFIEDGIETKCVYDGNLSILTRASNSFLNTDQTPGAFWLTNPDNIFINNHVVGSDAYGYWFDMQTTAIGASFDPNICPEYTKLGEFRNNTAHGLRKYGLRIFHALVPKTYPCKPHMYDPNYLENGFDDAYHENPKIPAYFEDFVSWKAGRNGAISERTGEVIFKNFRIADVGICGMEYSTIQDIHEQGRARIEGGMVIGNTGLNDDDGIISSRTVWGVIGPKTEWMLIDGVSFYNFNFQNSSCVGTCSHCFHPASTDSGGRTLTTNNLKIDDATCPRRIRYQAPFREIIHDLDGSLTGLGPDTWATVDYPHVRQPECTVSLDVHNGVICDSSVQIRALRFTKETPWSITGQKIKFARWDVDIEESLKSDALALFDFEQDVNHEHFSRLDWRKGPDPKGWPVAVVTGKRYRFHWGEGVDFEQFQLYSDNLITQATDLPIMLMSNFTDRRAAINVTLSGGQGELLKNKTFALDAQIMFSGGNVIYNQTEVRQFHMYYDFRTKPSRTNLLVQGFRCVWDCEEPILDDCEMAAQPLHWSDPATWESGAVPVEGDEVEIPNCIWIQLDIDETPLLKSLTINGRLEFVNDPEVPVDRLLKSKWVYVRKGELLIGSKDVPYNGNAEIRLVGAPNDETAAFSVFTEAGNKVLATVGLIEMYGQPRDGMSRLKETVYYGGKELRVDYGLDWKEGDNIVVFPTAMQNRHFDYVTISSYDPITGIVTLVEPLRYYHWGAHQSTGDNYSGVDMRAEVVLLSRNVKVVGEDTDWWGGQILVTDNLELTTMTQRVGQLMMDNVEVRNCSQRNTHRSAIRFENANTGQKWSSITNSAVWGSQMWAFSAQYSKNVYLEGNAFVGARAIGLGVFASSNITIVNNIIGDEGPREEFDLGSAANTVDKEACVSVCAYFGPDDKCFDNVVMNNIAAGCNYAGFVVPGHNCGDYSSRKFKNNVAHSIDGSGAHIFPDVTAPNHIDCYEGSYFSSYKTAQHSVGTHFKSKETRISHIVQIDAAKGISLTAGVGDVEKAMTSIRDTQIYGETEALDCPKGHNCWCQDKFGHFSQSANHGGKEFHITMASALPMRKVKSYGAFYASNLDERVEFINFPTNKTLCGAKQRLFGLVESASDHIPPQEFKQFTLNNVGNDAIAYIMDPKPGWANIDDCVAFPCTAPSNVVYWFQNTKFSGNTYLDTRNRNFQIVADMPGVSETYNNCMYQDLWNAWLCENEYLGQLIFAGDDWDQEDRTVAPVWVTNEATGYANKLNSQMDHMWDGFYTGQKHKSQFTCQLQTNENYTIEYTSTPFKNMRYYLRAQRGQVKVKIQYWTGDGSYEVYANGVKIDYAPWDKEAGRMSELSGYHGCGENRYVGVENWLEFIITPNCLIEVKPVDAILSNTRLSWTLNEFYESGGPTRFRDRVCAALGIHASQLKVVAVYEGSVVVEYAISSYDYSQERNIYPSSQAQLNEIEKNLNRLLRSENAKDVFGAPVLSASTNTKQVIFDPNYDEVTNNPLYKKNPTAAATVDQPQEDEIQITEEVKEAPILDEVSRNSLIGVFAVLGLIIGVCFVCGVTILCLYRIQRASKDVVRLQQKHAQNQQDKKQGVINASESVLEVDKQVDPTTEAIDVVTKARNRKAIELEDIVTPSKNFGTRESELSHVYDTSSNTLNNMVSLSETKMNPSTDGAMNNEMVSDSNSFNDNTSNMSKEIKKKAGHHQVMPTFGGSSLPPIATNSVKTKKKQII